MGQENDIKGRQAEKERKFPLLAEHVILYFKDPQQSRENSQVLSAPPAKYQDTKLIQETTEVFFFFSGGGAWFEKSFYLLRILYNTF